MDGPQGKEVLVRRVANARAGSAGEAPGRANNRLVWVVRSAKAQKVCL